MDIIKDKPIVKIVMLKGADGTGSKLSEHENDAGFLTREEIITLVTNIIESGEVGDIDTGFVTKLVEQNRKKALQFWVGTQAEYDALTEKTANMFYIITDDNYKQEVKERMDALDEKLDAIHLPDFERELAAQNTKIEEMSQDIETFKSDTNTAIETFKSDTNTNIDNKFGDYEGTIDAKIAAMETKLAAITYNVGDRIAIVVETAGYLSSGKTQIVFTVPLDKYLANNQTAGVAALTVRVRQDGNYLIGTASTTETYYSKNVRVVTHNTYAVVTITLDNPLDNTALNNGQVSVSGTLNLIVQG